MSFTFEFREGSVVLVGAGPGDPGLLTRAGESALRQADVVLHDALANDELLELCRPDAELIHVGKRSGAHSVPQEETSRLLVEHARRGRRVVRLKGGDPFLFGRGGEEALACAQAGVPCSVTPGVTSAFAGPAAAGIPVTHRGVAASVLVLHGRDDETDWEAAAKAADTIVVLMGVERVGDICARLLAAGRPAEEPAAFVASATLPAQQEVFAALATLAGAVSRLGSPMPGVLVFGPSVDVARQLAVASRGAPGENPPR